MNNLSNFNYNNIKLRLDGSSYWDFYMDNDDTNSKFEFDSPVVSPCRVVDINFNNSSVFVSGVTSIKSTSTWSGVVNTGYTFYNFGLCALDNGRLLYNKFSGDTLNTGLTKTITGSTLVINSGQTELRLNSITGYTSGITYPISLITGVTTNYINFTGGFFQGFYKIWGSNYEVLPNRMHDSWSLQFWLNKASSNTNTGTTLNTLKPNNTGFFYFWGARAENKFWSRFDGLNTGCTSGCTISSGCTDAITNWCTPLKETTYNYYSANTMSLQPNQIVKRHIDNDFLIYGRSHNSADGLGDETIYTYSGGGVDVLSDRVKLTDRTNPFLIYGRSHNSADGLGDETIYTYSGDTRSIKSDNLDYKNDIIDNALGFRIKEDGSIGIRLLTYSGNCAEDGYIKTPVIFESYSQPGMVINNVWTSVIVRFKYDEKYSDCDLIYGKKRNCKLMFYVNGRLKHVVKNFTEFIPKYLDEDYMKQLGVAYNISLGGGSQGLIDSITLDGLDSKDRNLEIETNFAGTFIGGISSFKMNLCDLDYVDIQKIYKSEKNNFN